MGRSIGLGLVLVLACGSQDQPVTDTETAPAVAVSEVDVEVEAPEPEADAPKLQDDLGDHHHAITTKSEQAQRYFDQGLVLTFGFNHEGAVDAFSEAARLDPSCAMCFWGVAIALGPNINAPMGPEAGLAAYEAVQKAQAVAAGASEAEQAYIAALARRYASDPEAERAPLDLAYAEAMREVHQAHPDDVDAATLFAEALMDLSPWDYYTPEGEPRAHTDEAILTLETVLEKDAQHPGANHYLIHVLEEYDPERAEAAADRLAQVAPGAGHLVHMPSHIYWRVGRYDDAIEANQKAVAADEAYFAWCRAPAFYEAGYYNHNLHFIWAAAAAQGQSDLALTSARRLKANIPEQEIAALPFLEDFWVIPTLTLARFGQWDTILGEPQPAESLRYSTGIWHYARALAHLRKGDPEAAEKERAALEPIANDPDMAALVFDVAGGTAGQRLQIAHHHLVGELAAASGNHEAATAALEEAVRVQDGMNYIEPPAFYFPVRQALGAVLLEAGRPEDADAVYRTDLREHPGNGWSLYGLFLSLDAQDKEQEAGWARTGFQNAWAQADVELPASRF